MEFKMDQANSKPTAREHSMSIIWLVAFVALVALACFVFVWPYDLEISQYFRTTKLPGELQKLVNISEAFAHGTGIAVILIALFWLDPVRRKKLLLVALVVVMASVAANSAKRVYPRIRPHTDGDVYVTAASDSWLDPATVKKSETATQSFPSGHSTATVSFALGLAFVYPRGAGLFLCLAMLACLQRVASAAHYPTDVFAGAFLGSLLAGSVFNRHTLSLFKLDRSGNPLPQSGSLAEKPSDSGSMNNQAVMAGDDDSAPVILPMQPTRTAPKRRAA
jgi:membrane-associated phospholipid phosphatase